MVQLHRTENYAQLILSQCRQHTAYSTYSVLHTTFSTIKKYFIKTVINSSVRSNHWAWNFIQQHNFTFTACAVELCTSRHYNSAFCPSPNPINTHYIITQSLHVLYLVKTLPLSASRHFPAKFVHLNQFLKQLHLEIYNCWHELLYFRFKGKKKGAPTFFSKTTNHRRSSFVLNLRNHLAPLWTDNHNWDVSGK